MKYRQLVTIPVIAGLLLTVSSVAHAAIIAQAGFNDALGINSDITAGSPYAVGAPINGSGAGEPGWSSPWFGRGTVGSSPVFEGDGAAALKAIAGPARVLASSLTGEFWIEQHTRFSPLANFTASTEQSTGEETTLQGPIWQALPDGKFYVIDGVGDGAITAPQEFSGFTWQPDIWYKVTVHGNVATQTWSFAVNDIPYLPPDPLGFRDTPTFLNEVRYLADGVDSGTLFLDAVTVAVVPEPASAALIGVGAVELFLRRRRTR